MFTSIEAIYLVSSYMTYSIMPHKYKIALVKQGEFNGGGVSSVCAFLYKMISSRGSFEIHLFSIETAYDSPFNLRLLSPKSWIRGIGIYDYSWHNIPARHVGACFSELEFQRYMPRNKLTELINNYDLVQIVSGSPAIANVVRNVEKPICIFMATLVKQERKSVLQTTNIPRKVYGRIMLPIISSIEKKVLNHVNHIFAETEYTRQLILPYVDASKITIDTIGVDIKKYQPISEHQRTDDYILSVGRFEDARKNVTLLFEAYALLRKNTTDAPKLIIAGKTAPSKSAWDKAKHLKIIEYIIFKKGVDLDELINLYQNAAVFVISSNEEGLGIVLLEAMACATPVISTRCGGPESIVSDNIGFLIPVGDAVEMAKMIQWMLQNPDQRRRMGQAGRDMVVSRFSDEVVEQKYLIVYNKLLGI